MSKVLEVFSGFLWFNSTLLIPPPLVLMLILHTQEKNTQEKQFVTIKKNTTNISEGSHAEEEVKKEVPCAG